jgi:hypothetical protein
VFGGGDCLAEERDEVDVERAGLVPTAAEEALERLKRWRVGNTHYYEEIIVNGISPKKTYAAASASR